MTNAATPFSQGSELEIAASCWKMLCFLDGDLEFKLGSVSLEYQKY